MEGNLVKKNTLEKYFGLLFVLVILTNLLVQYFFSYYRNGRQSFFLIGIGYLAIFSMVYTFVCLAVFHVRQEPRCQYCIFGHFFI